MLEFLDGRFQFLAIIAAGGNAVKPYPLVEDLVRPVLGVAMPRAPRVVAPGGTIHVVARCNNREFYLAALRYLDRNAVRAGLVKDPTTYPWSSCAAYALGTPNRVIAFHPSYLALSPYAKVRQRQYRTLLAPSEDPRADARDPRWTTQRAVGSPALMGPYVRRRGRRRIETMPSQNQEVNP